MLKVRAAVFVHVLAACLSAVRLVLGCEDVHLPAIVLDGGGGHSGAGGDTGGEDGNGPACAPPTTACDGACHDLATSNEHCGACNEECSGGASCFAGSCVCPAGQTRCNSFCVDTQADPKNCGACENDC